MEGEQISIIDKQFTDGNSLVDYLKNQRELTLSSEAENNFRKNILLSVASYFEKEITEIVIEFARDHSDNDELIVSIITLKAVKRQYHTYFDWNEAKNANLFFSMFGENFKSQMIKKVKADPKLAESIKAFLELGQERNKLVHLNYAEVVLDKTAEEIYTLYKLALYFIETIKIDLLKQDKRPITTKLYPIEDLMEPKKRSIASRIFSSKKKLDFFRRGK